MSSSSPSLQHAIIRALADELERHARGVDEDVLREQLDEEVARLAEDDAAVGSVDRLVR